MIKAILIDPDELRRKGDPIRSVEIEDSLTAIYRQLSYGRAANETCDCVQAVDLRMDDDFVYVDEEALLKGCRDTLVIEGNPTPMAGKAIAMGCGPHGEETDLQSVTEDWLRERVRIVIDGWVHRFEDGAWGSAADWRYGDTDREILKRLVEGTPADPLPGYDAASIAVPPPNPFPRHNMMIDPTPDPSDLQRFGAIINALSPDLYATYPKLEELVRLQVMKAVRQAVAGENDNLARSALVREHFVMDALKPLHGEGTEAMAEKAAELAADLAIAMKIRILIELGCEDAPILACFETDNPEPM